MSRQSLDFVAPLFVPGNRPERFGNAAVSGADAIITDLENAVPADGNDEALAALRVDLTSRASRLARGLPPLDGVTTTLDDDKVVIGDSRHARDIGFGGKFCIYPRLVNAIMTSGDGAVSVDGAMVDEPVRLHARSILVRSNIYHPAG